LLKENPADPFARSGMVWALGLAEVWDVNDDEYTSASDQRLAILEQLVKEYPASAEFRRDLANQLLWSPNNVVGAPAPQVRLGELNRANELRAAVLADMKQKNPAIWLPLRPRNSEALLLKPSLAWAKRDLARGWLWSLPTYETLHQWPQALDLADRSVALYLEVTAENPSIAKFSNELRLAFMQDAQAAEMSGDATGAQARRKQADDYWHSHPATTN
jgi:hypothetical protein